MEFSIEILEEDLRKAAKAQDSIRLTVLRLLKSALKNQEIEVGHTLSTPEILAVLQKEAKKRQDSIEQYTAASRDDLVQEETSELKIIDSYLPEKLSESELSALASDCIVDLQASSMADMGKVIAAVMAKSEGKADGSTVAQIVKKQLSK